MGRVTLTVLGSADAFNASGRGHACYLIDDPQGSVCVDFGPTAMAALKRLGRDPNQLQAVFLTHLHGDHFGGLQTFLVDAYYRGFRTSPFVLAGPPGTARRVETLFRLAYASVAERPAPFPFEVREYRPGETISLAGRTVQVFQADHQDPPREIACVLRVNTEGSVLAFSGDTGWTPELVAASSGADVFLCECTFYDQDVPQHLSWRQLEPRLGELTPRRLVLTHLSREMRAQADALRRGGRVEVAEDGMVIEL